MTLNERIRLSLNDVQDLVLSVLKGLLVSSQVVTWIFK